MKRLLFVVALLCPFLPYAQSYVDTNLTNDTLQTAAEVFGQLDLTQTATGLLMDQSYHYYLPEHFDGVTLDSNSLLNFDQFSLLYATIYGAGAGSGTLPPHPDVYNNASDAYDDGDPLGLNHVPSGFLYDRIGELPHPDSKENASRLPDFPEKFGKLRPFRRRFAHVQLWRNGNVQILDFREENALRALLECRYLAGMN